MDITFKDVSYIYQANTPFEHRALSGVSFHIPSGSFVAVIGHTGSGKSTLLQHLNGLLRPTEGKVMIGDYQISAAEKTKDIKSLREKVGVVFQYPEHQLFEETVAKDIGFGPLNFNVEPKEIERRTGQAIKAVGLPEDLLQRSPFDLSGGQMRRVAIAGVLAMNPEVLVLDEPTAGLDPSGQREIMDMFSRQHKNNNLTTVLVTHSMEDALRYADHIIIMKDGEKYMEGAPLEVLVNKEELQRVQLDLPEVIQFLHQAEKQFGKAIPYRKQGIAQLAKELTAVVKGGESHG
ncbi:energy-coupling factor transporter ATP-binding protein EcfA2 [Thalassobacillus devorans]|uniref:Energy-coupling factor transporter ATP-binding protein EcfA2 n=1 Tax=Thalassobacillus devorans TaxID=279813 RepID=A0ABQ1PT81_9BACI|nr:energy-coupling factor ABC transporter ATP-binding protein [Thalassobacillus devorans]NIK30763.1 energy-coupling factor transport system ATP-binding protein [Thalassobacillus devorans]GGD03223.1 energy-coupling factor transporter ATP-binding protein EcfA2 [Thalassobacillus devorans]